MLKTLLSAAAVAAFAATATLASGAVELSETNTQKIRQVLTEQGYEVAKIKIEDGLYEAYARKDGKRFEVFLDGDFGVVRTEEDD